MILDEVMPAPEFSVRVRATVRADLETTWAALPEANLFAYRWVRMLFGLRDAPTRLWYRIRGREVDPAPRSITLRDIAELPGWGVLGEAAPREIVLGSVGQFWRSDYGWRDVAASEFAGFSEPGFAKTVAALRLDPLADGRTLVTYESQTATTSRNARWRFRLYWLLLKPGAWLVMGRALAAIRAEAEARKHTTPEAG